MGKLILVLGGARSGKSTFAEERAREVGAERVLYVATAEAKDEEMRERVEKHRASRPASWRTLETSRNVGQTIQEAAGNAQAILVDCWTMLIANRLLTVSGPLGDPFGDPAADPFDTAIEAEILAEGEMLLACVNAVDSQVIVVSNEVGMGLVPPYDLGRAYRDLLGRANQQLAKYADEVFLLVAGIPMRIK